MVASLISDGLKGSNSCRSRSKSIHHIPFGLLAQTRGVSGDILPRIGGGMYRWSNSSRTKSSKPMLTADEIMTMAEELVIASIDTEPGTTQRKARSTIGDLPRWMTFYRLPEQKKV
ncbi:hypothetical protein VNO80_25230 [Phaseolus coccineus]|uniref:Uncharacterized protein n=1 Tax=Phaseolus coccineus TaxID=3886 RepID=A0AAN9LY73_PHACN